MAEFISTATARPRRGTTMIIELESGSVAGVMHRVLLPGAADEPSHPEGTAPSKARPTDIAA